MVVVAAALLAGAKVIGFQTYSVLSGSMEPTYHTGSLIYVKKTDPQDIRVGDPITFVLDENLTVATHRVIKIDDPNQHFYTQGDANEYPDASPVHYKNLIGKPVFTIPYLGYFAGYVKDPPGRYLALAAAAIIILLVFLPDLFDDKDKDKDSKGRLAAGKRTTKTAQTPPRAPAQTPLPRNPVQNPGSRSPVLTTAPCDTDGWINSNDKRASCNNGELFINGSRMLTCAASCIKEQRT